MGAGTRDERVRGRLYANMLHHSEIRSRDIQGLFFSVAQSKNEDRDRGATTVMHNNFRINAPFLANFAYPGWKNKETVS